MSEQDRLSQLQGELQGKIGEINELKGMLLREIEEMRAGAGSEGKRREVVAQAQKLGECVTVMRSMMQVFRREIVGLPKVLGEQIGAVVLKIKDSFARQRLVQLGQIDRLKHQLTIKSQQSHSLLHKITVLQHQLKTLEQPSTFQQTSTDDICSRSPAIEYPHRLDTIAEQDEIVVLLEEYKNKRGNNGNALRTEPEVTKFTAGERSISYKKIDVVKARSRTYIQDFRRNVEISNVGNSGSGNQKYTNHYFEQPQPINNYMCYSHISQSKSSTSQAHSQLSIKTQLTKKHSYQQPRQISRKSIGRKESKQKIQVTQKMKSQLTEKDCNAKIKVTIKEQDMRKSAMGYSKVCNRGEEEVMLRRVEIGKGEQKYSVYRCGDGRRDSRQLQN